MPTYDGLVAAINGAGTAPVGLHSISKNTQFLKTKDNYAGIILFQTLVGLWPAIDPPWLILHHGTWRTRTTYARMNPIVQRLTNNKVYIRGIWDFTDAKYNRIDRDPMINSIDPISIDLHKVAAEVPFKIMTCTPEQKRIYHSINNNPRAWRDGLP